MAVGLDAAALPSDAVEVGRILEPWGVQGWCKVRPYSPEPEVLLCARRWYLLPPETGPRSFEEGVLARVRQVKWHASHLVAAFHDIDGRDAALGLKGARIFVPRSIFPSTKEDEFYWVDLMGLTVVNREGIILGQVADLMNAGPQTVLVCQPAQATGCKSTPVLIPFVSTYVDAVCLPERLIRVDWQPDY
ncbi:MAG: ribosome maturation factor RimM [Rhodoferax sp.]